MISRFSGKEGMRRRSEDSWHHARWLTVALTVVATGFAACDEGGGEGGGGGTATKSPETHLTTPPKGDREPILVKTRVRGFAGKVLPGSVVGDSPFCPGGTVRHEHGSPDIGFPAVNVFLCADGQLEIGFGPGPDQMNNVVQTSYWEVLDGRGSFAGTRGHGRMTVRFASLGSSRGEETFRGFVVVP